VSDAPGPGPEAPPPPPRDDSLASVVRIERRDDVAAVCGRIDSAPTFAVVIHAPQGSRQAQTQLGMRRLVRHAEETGRIIAIATRSRALAARARQAGVPVGRRPERIRWDSGGRRVLWLGPQSVVLPGLGRYVQFAMLAAVVVALLALAFTLGPSADVVLSPPLEEVTLNVELTGSPDRVDTDTEALLVPATEVQTTRRVTLARATTGTADVPVGRATVLVTLSNATAEDVTLPLHAVLIASPGNLHFRLDQETVVPAGSVVVQQASAVEPGPSGNVAAATITRWEDDLYEIEVSNAEAASGGTTEQRPAVSAEDVVALQTLATTLQSSQELMKAVVEDRTDVGVFTRTVVIEAVPGPAVPSVGEPGTVVFVEVELIVSALAVPADSLERMARDLMSEGAPGVLVSGSISAVETGRGQVDTGDGGYTSEFTITAGFSPVSTDEIRELVKGRSPGDARSVLRERYAIDDAEVDLVPGFMPWLPRFDFRIDVAFRAPGEPGATPAEEPPDTPSPTEDDATATPTPTTARTSSPTQTPGP
jgi:hypothetical protein